MNKDATVLNKLCCKCGYDISQDPDVLQVFQDYSYQGIGRWVEIYKCLDCQVIERDEAEGQEQP